MRTHLAVFIALVGLALAACGLGTVEQSPTTTQPSAESPTAAPSETDPPPETVATSPGGQTSISDRPVAPDFTLELGEGGVYTLSQGERPVYLVFWAEW